MPMRVLVFDDDPALGRIVVRIASMAGLKATAVSDAGAFEQSLRTDPPEIVVLDLQLGDTDGVEQLRKLAEWKYAGILILVSGHGARVLATVDALGKGLGLKIECVVEKPLRIKDLEAVFTRLTITPEALTSARLLAAIKNDEMALEFQPIVSMKPKMLKKLEALIRWEHPVAGLIMPNMFIPVAEANAPVIDALTDWVVNATIDAYQVLTQLGVSIPIALNISTLNLRDLTLPDRLEQRLRAGGMPPDQLCLEVTESSAFQEVNATMDVLSRLRLKSMSLSIDDFGTGYSSLKLLRQMPFSEIKIDRSFVLDMIKSRDSRAIVKSIIDLAANLEMKCVAEGVETDEIAAALGELGACDLQGYTIARPMAVESIPAWLELWMATGFASVSDSRKGGVPEQASMANRLVETVPAHPAMGAGKPPEPVRLSPRQLDVMRLLSDGLSVKEIARKLALGVGTIKVHLSLAYSALGAHNRVEAIRQAAPMLDDRPPINNETNDP